jgi:hypothetical protein
MVQRLSYRMRDQVVAGFDNLSSHNANFIECPDSIHPRMSNATAFIMRQASPKRLGTFQKDVKPEIWQSWLDFIYNCRHFEGNHANLIIPEKRWVCFCGRAQISYPHWPPTTLPEAFDQLDCLLATVTAIDGT